MNAAAAAAASSTSSSPNMEQKSNLCVNTGSDQYVHKQLGFNPDMTGINQQHSLSSSCSNSSSVSNKSSHGLTKMDDSSFSNGYSQNASINTALAVLASQYPANSAINPIFNPSAMAAMAHLQNNPMQNLMTSLLGNLINKDQSAGNCYNIE